MYTHILIAIDGSKLADKALKSGVQLAKSLGAELTSVYVAPEYSAPAYGEGAMFSGYVTKTEFKKRHAEFAASILANVEAAAKKAGVKATGVAVEDNAPYEAIIKTATKRKCDLIVMASHGRRGLAGVLLGSETQKVLTHSKIPVLVVR